MIIIESEADEVIGGINRILEKVQQAAVGVTQQPAG